MGNQFKTAILFLVFNRLDTTRQVFEAIRQAKPSRLYVAADGPRASRPDDLEKVKNVRDYILGNIDWECDLKTLFRDGNLGCKLAVSSAISWFFDNEEMGIILEDDCLPHISFFQYCQELLEYYKSNPQIMMISGDNFQSGKQRGNGSYYFSMYSCIWGWATWKRAWDLYDVNMSTFLQFKAENKIRRLFKRSAEQKYWLSIFEKVFNMAIDTWDYQWVYSVFASNGLSITPNVNLVSNIGFGVDSVHTKNQLAKNAKLPTNRLIFPLEHPAVITCNINADKFLFVHFFKVPFYRLILGMLKKKYMKPTNS